MKALPHLASATLVAAFLVALLVNTQRFLEYRTSKAPAVWVLQIKGPPL